MQVPLFERASVIAYQVFSEEHVDIEHRVSGIEHCYAGFVFPITPPTKDCAALRICLKHHLFLTLINSATHGCLCLQWIMSLEI